MRPLWDRAWPWAARWWPCWKTISVRTEASRFRPFSAHTWAECRSLLRPEEACRNYNYQQADGSVVVPEALRPYMGGQAVLAP